MDLLKSGPGDRSPTPWSGRRPLWCRGRFEELSRSLTTRQPSGHGRLGRRLEIHIYFLSPRQPESLQHSVKRTARQRKLRNVRSDSDLPSAAAEQRAIAHILGTLDDKIELNRRMNETLEAMARALFKSWFVDFDPVRAKAEGRDPGLSKLVADLFPDFLRGLGAGGDSRRVGE